MKENKKITTKENIMAEAEAVVTSHMTQDLKDALLVVSIVANLFIFTAWLVLQVTTQYDAQIAAFLFNR